ncbi:MULTISPECIES: hypothetical protein [unclassified Streptomyces]|uniref:DUF6197 family protein n=1 Tax=unclassified Streptomyces TaxID=2593676 RepID=UPI00380B97A2
MPTPTLTPAALDRAAALTRAETRAPAPTPAPAPSDPDWAGIVGGYRRTAPADPGARRLLTATVDELVEESLRALPAHGTRPTVDVHLPGRLSRALPDWAHRHRVDLSHPPSTQLAVAAEILRVWGWQQRPHHLRNRRGRRCICGALVTTVALGVGTEDNAARAAGHVLGELRNRGWGALIGDWNQVPGRTAEQALDLVVAAQGVAARAGE